MRWAHHDPPGASAGAPAAGAGEGAAPVASGPGAVLGLPVVSGPGVGVGAGAGVGAGVGAGAGEEEGVGLPRPSRPLRMKSTLLLEIWLGLVKLWADLREGMGARDGGKGARGPTRLGSSGLLCIGMRCRDHKACLKIRSGR